MSISMQEMDRRYSAIRDWMRRREVDCLIASGRSDYFNRGNIRYLTGLGNGGYCIVPFEGTPVLLVGRKIELYYRKEVPLDVIEAGNPVETVGREIARFDKGNKLGIIGFDQALDPLYKYIEEKYQGRLVDATEIFEPLRLIKSDEEIEKIRISCWIADRVFHMLREMVRPDLSDFEIYGAVKHMIYNHGCEYSMDLLDANGATMNMKFNPVGDRLSAAGTLFMEITPAYDGYYGQLPVTIPVVNPPAYIRKMAQAWVRAQEAGAALLRPGTKISELYHIMRKSVLESGYLYPFRPGHALGLDAIDFWSITETNDTVLQPRMTLAVHPPIVKELGGDGFGAGYTYLITETGAEKLSQVNLAEMY